MLLHQYPESLDNEKRIPAVKFVTENRGGETGGISFTCPKNETAKKQNDNRSPKAERQREKPAAVWEALSKKSGTAGNIF